MQVCRETRRLAEGGGWIVKVLGEEERERRANGGGEKERGKGKGKWKWKMVARERKRARIEKEGKKEAGEVAMDDDEEEDDDDEESDEEEGKANVDDDDDEEEEEEGDLALEKDTSAKNAALVSDGPTGSFAPLDHQDDFLLTPLLHSPRRPNNDSPPASFRHQIRPR